MSDVSDQAPAKTVSRVVKAPRVEAELGIAQRRAEATRMLDTAKSSAAELLTQTRERGFEEGRNHAIKGLATEIQMVLQDFTTLLQAQEDVLAEVVMTSVEKIIGAVPERQRVRMILAKALADILDGLTVVLKVAAEDLPLVRQALADLQGNGEGGKVTSIFVDPLLARGEMLLETERGRVHIGLAQQLTRLRAGLNQAVQPRS